MVRHLSSRVLFLLAVPALIQPAGAIGADEWPHEIPAKAKAILEGAEEFKLFSLDPHHDEKAKDTFHGWKILGKTEIEDVDVRPAERVRREQIRG